MQFNYLCKYFSITSIFLWFNNFGKIRLLYFLRILGSIHSPDVEQMMISIFTRDTNFQMNW